MTSLQGAIMQALKKEPLGMVNYTEMLEDHILPLCDAGVLDGASWYVREMFLAAKGSNCPNCGKPWVPVYVKNKIAEFHYYVPSCSCYPRCPFCGKVLLAEVMEKAKGCTNCMISREGSGIDAKYGLRCKKWTTEIEHKGKKVKVANTRCPGTMVPVLGGWECNICGAKLKMR